MKSYTDIEQSKKLAKILPLETADMWYGNEDPYKITIGKWKDTEHDEDDIPCWSLAALLDILQLPSLVQDKADNKLFWQCSIYDEYGTAYKTYDNNPVDTCVAMIETLHELKML
jgi:hypothetical protein